MHTISIPEHVVQRVVRLRGSVHPFADLRPERTALVVIDMQNAFMRADIGHACCPTAVEIVPAINRLATALRRAGGGVYWVQNTFNERSAREWSVLEDLTVPVRREARGRAMTAGSEGHALWPDLDVRPEDVTLPKHRYSAFIQGSSDLPERLRADGRDTVLITGTVTNVCCESSARDAMMLNFRTVMVSDGNAAMSDEEHNASLISFYGTFGDVMSVAELETCLATNTNRRAA
ncbi:isochorismatase family protein [Roseomonas sp. BN140053]|uniref:isochorismatase family protein n=1 Tax=Roseomonas sp. BN140053 TaxID=3391898 RepID=UPI0039EB71F9